MKNRTPKPPVVTIKNTVWGSSPKLSDATLLRIDKAIEYYAKKKVKHVLRSPPCQSYASTPRGQS